MKITVENLNKSFGKDQVLFNHTFTINSGDIVCLLGPSGSGKTTLIRSLIGAIKIDTGSIKFNQTNVPNLGLMKEIGFMPQNDALYDDLSCNDNLKFFGKLHKLTKDTLEQRIIEVLSLVDLLEEREKMVRDFSGGMKKRLSIAIALLHDPEVLLMDEPTVGIDPVLRRTIWNEFKQLNNQGKTIIVSTHVMDEVSECDKAMLIYNGRVINYDTIDNLLATTTNKKVEELFINASKLFEQGEII